MPKIKMKGASILHEGVGRACLKIRMAVRRAFPRIKHGTAAKSVR
jgi:hypothetical protein